jgi:hypothetical protein
MSRVINSRILWPLSGIGMTAFAVFASTVG